MQQCDARPTMTRSVTVEHIRGGQQRPYGDSIYEAYLTFSVPEDQVWASRFGRNEEVVKQYIPLFVHAFYEKPEWYQPRLTTLEQVSPGRWHVVVTQPYLD